MEEKSNCSYLTIFFFFFFFMVVPYPNHSHVNADSVVDLVNTTCKQCADRSPVIDHDLCLTSLLSVPAGDLQGLACGAIDLALRDATATVSAIKEMIPRVGDYDAFAMACLKDCLELYTDGESLLVDSVDALISGQYDEANICLSAVMDSSTTCEEGFKEKEGQVCPLTKDNYNVFQMSDVALCITKLLSEEDSAASMSS